MEFEIVDERPLGKSNKYAALLDAIAQASAEGRSVKVAGFTEKQANALRSWFYTHGYKLHTQKKLDAFYFWVEKK